MQVFCKSTSGNAEVQCCVCGQGFILFWERQSRSERVAALQAIQKTLRAHHMRLAGPEVHPQTGFLVPGLDGPAAFSGAAIQGHAPTWAL
jgi:hypothetical protein